MTGRRFYVIVADGERGPFTHEELRGALDAREIKLRDQVRSGMGTALGTVEEVLAQSSRTIPPTIGQTTDGLPPVRVFRPLPLIVLGVSVVPAVLLLVLLRGRDGEAPPGNRPQPIPSPAAVVPIIPAPPPITSPPPSRPSPPVPSSASPDVLVTPTGVATKLVSPEADGRLILGPGVANLSGSDITLERSSAGPFLNGWRVGINRATWQVQFVNPGTYRVVARYACPDSLAGGEVEVSIGSARKLRYVVKSTGSWDNVQEFTVGTFSLRTGGTRHVMVEPILLKSQGLWHLFSVSLIPE